MTWVAARLPPVVSTASPTSTGPWRMASSSMMTPPFRLMAPATPAPIASVEFAALTIASTSQSVMSPRSIETDESPILSFTAWPGCARGPWRTPTTAPSRPAGPRRPTCLRDEARLHLGEAAPELLDGVLQGLLGVDRGEPRHVHEREQGVRQAILHPPD